MNAIDALTKTTFSGRKFTRKQIAQIRDTVISFPHLSRHELALTLCEHLNWKNPAGKLKIDSCLKMLEQLQESDIIKLPTKKERKKPVHTIKKLNEEETKSPINDSIEAIAPIKLQRVTSKEERESFKAHIQAYHYLGYKRPFGSYLAYFVVSEPLGQKLGCLLFSASAAWALAPRDEFIGWDKKHREKLLNLIISNDRFVIFPWVKVPNLASQVLSLATKQIGKDWLSVYGYRPVLIETFVDTTKYKGTCYHAANWKYIGKTQGRGRDDPKHESKETVKDIFIYPLEAKWKEILNNLHQKSSLEKKYRNDLQASHTRKVDDAFVEQWERVAKVINEVAAEYDEKWQIRKRLINSLILVIFIFRLVTSKNSQSYGTTIDEIWDSCSTLNLPLPQKNSLAPSSLCTARKKLDESVFKRINQRIIETHFEHDERYTWKGHRIFAVDGSKLNIPRELISLGYKLPAKKANYPQGLLSCLYQVKSQIPFDFDLVSHSNERICAEQHLNILKSNDVVVYDRGYFSYIMLHRHVKSNIHAVFRLQESGFTVIREFFKSPDIDIIATIYPSPSVRNDILETHPELDIVPLRVRLIKYFIGDMTYCLGTTLLDQKRYNSIQDFMDIYHSRWGVEELYKVSKRLFIIEDFHAKSERGVKQEIFAHFSLVTMNRIFANQADIDLNQSDNPTGSTSIINSEKPSSDGQMVRLKTNFKNCIHFFNKSMEGLIMLHANIKSTVKRAFHYIVKRYSKERPGRSYPRKSMRPTTKFIPSKKSKKKQTQTIQQNNNETLSPSGA